MEIVIRIIIPVMLMVGIVITFLRWKLNKREAVLIIFTMLSLCAVLVFGELYRYYHGFAFATFEEKIYLFLTYNFRLIACVLLLLLITNEKKMIALLVPLQVLVTASLGTCFIDIGFSFDADNNLIKGFAVYLMWGVCFLYTLILFGHILHCIRKKKEKDNRVTLLFIAVAMLAGTAVETCTDICEIYAISLLICLTYWLYHYNIVITKNEVEKKNKELVERQTMVMVSQIQPHFLYNTLSAIMAISTNSPETTEALGNFGKYLRGNLDIKTLNKPIHFTREMEHVRTYLSLEKLRFGDKIEIEERIKPMNFFVPPLSVQMLVENAVKHGITARENGGKIIISTAETQNCYKIIIQDNGVGFDVNRLQTKEGVHIGLNNVKFRLSEMLKGELSIESEPLGGTTVTMTIPKK